MNFQNEEINPFSAAICKTSCQSTASANLDIISVCMRLRWSPIWAWGLHERKILNYSLNNYNSSQTIQVYNTVLKSTLVSSIFSSNLSVLPNSLQWMCTQTRYLSHLCCIWVRLLVFFSHFCFSASALLESCWEYVCFVMYFFFSVFVALLCLCLLFHWFTLYFYSAFFRSNLIFSNV